MKPDIAGHGQAMRLFVAIDLPPELKSEMEKLRRDMKGLRWVRDGQIHLTLNFLGDTSPDVFEEVKEQLRNISFSPFSMETTGCGFFPDARRPSIFWLGVEGSGPLLGLKGGVDAALVRSGIECEAREFKPHITLARFKGRPGKERTQLLLESFDVLAGRVIEVDRFYLFSSELGSGGAVHRVEAEVTAPPPTSSSSLWEDRGRV